MKLLYLLVSVIVLSSLAYNLTASPISHENDLSSASNVEVQRHLVREKRAPLGKKLALLGGAAVIGKKALLLGGAALGAKALIGTKLIGAGIIGAGLHKASYGGSYGGGYAGSVDHHYEWNR